MARRGGSRERAIARFLVVAATHAMNQMVIWDKAEPWIRGDPEIELWLEGAQDGIYFGATAPGGSPPFGAPTSVQFLPGVYRTVLSCAGRHAPVSAKRFDYNDEGGATYNGTVLIQDLPGFIRFETVEGPGGVVLHSRRVAIRPPFRLLAMERDDGGECPKVNSSVIEPQVIISWTGANGSFLPFKVDGPISWVLGLLGITNENDMMGQWWFNDWASFSALSFTELVGTHVSVRVTNLGVNAGSVPPELMPSVP